jgi:hypothetical protein
MFYILEQLGCLLNFVFWGIIRKMLLKKLICLFKKLDTLTFLRLNSLNLNMGYDIFIDNIGNYP